MAIRPNDEERGFSADRERKREVSNESGRSARPSTGENVAPEDSGQESGVSSGRSNRGFASMERGKQREIASKGGRAAHQKGTAHEFDSGEARAAGRKGGVTVSRNREHMAAIGRRGGEARGANRAARLQAQNSSDAKTPDAKTPDAKSPAPNTSQNGSARFQGDREVGVGRSASSSPSFSQPQRPSGNSLGGESRGGSGDERNIERP